MRNYKLSYFLAAVLMSGAFLAQYNEMKKPGTFRNDNISWVLFSGGIILTIIGSREYRTNQRERNKN